MVGMMKTETVRCSTTKCRCKATLQLLGKHPICRRCGDVKNTKSRARSAERRSQGLYSPSIVARWSEEKFSRMLEQYGKSLLP